MIGLSLTCSDTAIIDKRCKSNSIKWYDSFDTKGATIHFHFDKSLFVFIRAFSA